MYDKSMRYALMVDWGDSEEPDIIADDGFIYLADALVAAAKYYPNFIKQDMVWVVNNKGMVYNAYGSFVGEA